MSAAFDSNPFEDPVAENPFNDPAVTQVTKNTGVSQRGLEDYNPFTDQGNKAAGTGGQYGSSAPTLAATSGRQDNPPAYTASAQQKITTDELQKRQEELERKADELTRREEQLRTQQTNARVNNWPPLPQKCCVGPCFYQDINVDIPLEFQKTVRTVYYLWMLHSTVLLVNILGAVAMLISDGEIWAFVLSIVYFVIFTPASYLCWFRPAYKAFRNDSSFNFMVFFFMFFFQCVMTGIFAIGFTGMGACGWIRVFNTFNSSIVAGIIVLMVALAFTLVEAFNIIALFKIHRLYRNSGASIAKARQEFAGNVIRNEHVQSAAANVAAEAVRTNLSQQQAGGDGRY